MSTIGSRIRNRREELGLSQDELGRRLGYKSRSSINKIELDQRNLTQSKIKAIADALETTPAYIMGWNEQDQKFDGVKKSPGTAEAEPGETKLIELFRELNRDGQGLLIDYADTLVASEKYAKSASPVPSITIAARNGMRIERPQKEPISLPEESDIIP